MALARAALTGLVTFVACLLVGHSGAHPTTTIVVAAAPVPFHAPRDPYVAPPTTTSTAPLIVKASRSLARPRPYVGVDDAFWWRVSRCESPSNARSRNGLYGGYFQMTQQAWHGGGGEGIPETHGYDEQLVVAKAWAARTNPWRQWPVCWPRAARG